MHDNNTDNMTYLRVIKRAVQGHIQAGSADPIRDAIADTYPGTGEVMARANRAWLMGEADEPNDRRIGSINKDAFGKTFRGRAKLTHREAEAVAKASEAEISAL